MEIIRSRTEYSAVYQIVTIDGLNVLHQQNEDDGAELAGIACEPYREFIGELLATLSGSVLFGFYMTIDILDDLITEHRVHDLFEPVLMSVLQEEFFAVRPVTRSITGEHVVVEQSYFCSDIHRLLTDERLSRQDAWRFVFEGLLYDSIAIFLSQNAVDYQLMRELLDSRSETDEFIVRALALYDYILVSSYDGYHVELFTKVNCDTMDIERACAHAAKCISSLPWFIANKDGLKWDADTGCLRLQLPEDCNLESAVPTTVGGESKGLSRPWTPWQGAKCNPSEVAKSQVLRVETTEDGLYKETTVYGLNIFRHNQKPGSFANELAFEPYHQFLLYLLSELHGTALFFSDVARNWTAHFMIDRHLDNLIRPIPLSVWRGRFCYKPNFEKDHASTRRAPEWPFIINIGEMTRGSAVLPTDVSMLISQNLVDSGVAMFLSQRALAVPDFGELEPAVNRNLQHREFIERALALYDYAIVLESDGRIFSAITKLETDVSVIQRATDRSADYIASTLWFNENSANLRWVEMYGCWVLK